MKKDIILCGVGGQGILSIAAVIDMAALNSRLFIKQAEVHGMSQRGGAVLSHLRISDTEIFSDLIMPGTCDLILSVEPLESLRYLNFLHPDGWVVTASEPFKNMAGYPDEEKVIAEIRKLKNHRIIDAEALARKAGSVKASNIVMLGAASSQIGIAENELIHAIETIFTSKGKEIVDCNIKAFMLGREGSV